MAIDLGKEGGGSNRSHVKMMNGLCGVEDKPNEPDKQQWQVQVIVGQHSKDKNAKNMEIETVVGGLSQEGAVVYSIEVGNKLRGKKPITWKRDSLGGQMQRNLEELKHKENTICETEEELEEHIADFYKKLFTIEGSRGGTELLQNISHTISV
ncbi:lactate utilization protein B/C [Striga asiatica]|uniref:Lactate utilization protein B/C n=1 Tax=Striga asiatica TaxID=4170 RepID=A0A5A7Q3D3_STRAF|nr:lactate utilization protein B/C [Striga asiatica]